ncbi:LTA synthase family protein [Brevibacillus ginsengisoli]|uniref:LTA synthase family protein n=1 Tax=Brevibacillus ginsengisoli TaxID=363854 RepID=UPI003CF277E7
MFFYTIISTLIKFVLFECFMLNSSNSSSQWIHSILMIQDRLYLYVAFIIFFLSGICLLHSKHRNLLLVGANAFLSLVLIVDLSYARMFLTMPSIHSLLHAENVKELVESVVNFTQWSDLVFIVDLLVIAIFNKRLKPYYSRFQLSRLPISVMFLLSLLVILYIPVTTTFFGQKDEKSLFKMMDSTITSYNLSPLGYHLLDSYLFFKEGFPQPLTQTQQNQIGSWFIDKEEPLPNNQYQGLFKGKNLIVIQVESLERFVLQRTIDGQEITPTLNKMVKNGLYFSNIYEQVNQGTTSDAEFMTNTSIYPLRQGSTFFNDPNNVYHSLPVLLKQNEYSTVALHSDKASYWNWAQALRSIGFEKTVDSSHFVHDGNIGMGLSDGSFLRQAVPVLNSMKPPFYSFIVTLSSHFPYNLPDTYRDLKLEKSLDRSVAGGYIQSVHYVDKQIGQFLNELDRKGILQNSVVVVYGDHEGVHKYFRKEMSSYPEFANGKRVPLIIYHTGMEPKQIDTVGGQIDIFPTLAYLMGVPEEKYKESAIGRNLLKTSKSFAVLSDETYVGTKVTESEKRHRQQGLSIADQMIRSDYFRN